MEREIITYLSRITSQDNSEGATRRLQTMFRTISHIEQIGDGNLELARILRTKKERNLWFNQELRDKLGSLFDLVEQALYVMVTNLENPTAEGVERSRAIEQQINLTSARLRGEQLQEAQGQDYKYMAGIAFIEMWWNARNWAMPPSISPQNRRKACNGSPGGTRTGARSARRDGKSDNLSCYLWLRSAPPPSD